MIDLIVFAIPFFVLFVVLEIASYWFAPDDDEVGYAARDTATSITMGLGNVALNGIVFKALEVVVLAAAYELSPLRIDPGWWWAWALLFVLDDLAYYWFHRVHHEVRVFWASHVVHHSSRHFNLSTAVRQTWTPLTSLPFYVPLALLGFPPWMLLLQQSVSLIYQFFLHTERVDRLWRPLELVLNTPSHHRVHHAINAGYLDRNYGGVLIVWDRLFGTFTPEGERTVYGLTKQLRTHNPLVVAFGEYASIWRDVRADRSWRIRGARLLRGPGWTPPTAGPAAAPGPVVPD